MQAFAGDRPGIASNEVSTCPEYFNFEPKENESARHWPVFNDKGRVTHERPRGRPCVAIRSSALQSV